MKTCPSCSGFVPTASSSCPNCGEKPRGSIRTSALLTLVGTSVAAVTLMACYGGPPCDYDLPDGGTATGYGARCAVAPDFEDGGEDAGDAGDAGDGGHTDGGLSDAGNTDGGDQ